jgi:hypothetical protein
MRSLFDDNLRVVIPGRPVLHRSDEPSENATLADGMKALARLKPFMATRQSNAVAELMRTEEGQFFIDKMVEMARLVDAMPVTYQQKDESDPVAWLHYFYGGSDWYIIEKDVDGEVDEAFGFACLNGDMMCAEYGYIPISELVESVMPYGMTVDLDLHFAPTRMSEVRRALEVKNGN